MYPTQVVNHPITHIENLGLNAFRFHFVESVDLTYQNVDLTAEFRQTGDVKPEVLAAFYCPCNVKRGITAPTKMVVETEVTVDTSLEFHPDLLDQEHRSQMVKAAKLVDPLLTKDYSIIDVKFVPMSTSPSNPLATQDQKSRCIQTFQTHSKTMSRTSQRV